MGSLSSVFVAAFVHRLNKNEYPWVKDALLSGNMDQMGFLIGPCLLDLEANAHYEDPL